MVTVKVYVEGGGDNLALHTKCRRGFRLFLEKAGLKGRMPRIVACGGREDAYDSFRTAVGAAGEQDYPMLLVDSEAPVAGSTWEHLEGMNGWQRPAGAADEQAHLMVQCMEAWFLADREHLEAYFGKGFIAKHLPGHPRPEEVPKSQVMDGLKMATREARKGTYSKGSHAFEILGGLDHRKVRSLPHAQEFLAVLEAKLG